MILWWRFILSLLYAQKLSAVALRWIRGVSWGALGSCAGPVQSLALQHGQRLHRLLLIWLFFFFRINFHQFRQETSGFFWFFSFLRPGGFSPTNLFGSFFVVSFLSGPGSLQGGPSRSKPQKDWVSERRDIKLHQLCRLSGEDSHQKSNTFPVALWTLFSSPHRDKDRAVAVFASRPSDKVGVWCKFRFYFFFFFLFLSFSVPCGCFFFFLSLSSTARIDWHGLHLCQQSKVRLLH